MIVRITRDGVGVDDVLGLRSLEVSSDVPADTIDGALRRAGAGTAAGAHAWLDIDWLRAAGPADDQWRADFAAMIDYAVSRGWRSVDGARVRAHVG